MVWAVRLTVVSGPLLDRLCYSDVRSRAPNLYWQFCSVLVCISQASFIDEGTGRMGGALKEKKLGHLENRTPESRNTLNHTVEDSVKLVIPGPNQLGPILGETSSLDELMHSVDACVALNGCKALYKASYRGT